MAEVKIHDLPAITAAEITDTSRNYLVIEHPRINGLRKIPISDIVEIVRGLKKNA